MPPRRSPAVTVLRPAPGRVPPHNLDAEASVLSAVFMRPEVYDAVAGMVQSEHFYSDANRRIFEALTELAVGAQPIDIVTVATRLRAHGRLDQVGGTPYLRQIMDSVPAVANVAIYAEIVRDAWQKRQLIARCQTFAAEAYDAPVPGAVLAAQATGALIDLVSAGGAGLAKISGTAIFEPQPSVPWLIEALDLCPGAPGLVGGYGFAMKSLTTQSAALAIATGSAVWGSFAARKGRVLHLDYEQGRRLTIDRYQRLAAGMGLTPDCVGDAISVVVHPSIYLDDPAAEAVLVRECRGYALLIVDSLRAAAPTLDENTSMMRAPLDMLARVSERTGVTVLVIHHARKPQKDSVGGARAAIRGTGAIYDACATVFVFEGAKGEPVRVTHEKARISGKTHPDFCLRAVDIVDDDGRTIGVRVVADVGGDVARCAAPDRAERTSVEAAVVDAVRAAPGIILTRLREAVGGRGEVVDDVVRDLVEQGRMVVRPGAHGAHHHYLPEDAP